MAGVQAHRTAFGGRSQCYGCGRPQRMCLCAAIPRVDNRTPVWVLQHPRERRHPLGTLALLQRSLARLQVRVAFPFERGTLCTPLPLSAGAALLYPHPEAPPLEALPAGRRPKELLVLDGSWACSRALYRDNPWLRALPHVALRPNAPGRYRVRREPRPEYVSTLEAVVLALRALEPSLAGLDELVGAFERLQDEHLRERARRPSLPRTRRPRQRARRTVPPVIYQRSRRLVLVYVEPSLRDLQGRRWCRQVVLCRPADGGLLQCFGAGGPASTPGHLAQMGLTVADVAEGLSAAALGQRVRAFLGDDAVLACWSGAYARLLTRALALPHDTLALKHIYCSLRQARAGSLAQACAREGLQAAPLPLRGRAAERMGQALCVLDLLRREGAECARWPTTRAPRTASAPSVKPPAD